jgi:protein N-terminal amidase
MNFPISGYTTVSVTVQTCRCPARDLPPTNYYAGYNFKSLQQISPYLEPSGSGISSLWARTTALKYNTNVVVGYPERVDVTPMWPTGPEYYNSAIIVNGDGETVANYRKSFLYWVDESWALEGKHGFFEGHVRGLGQTAMGICKDLHQHSCCYYY